MVENGDFWPENRDFEQITFGSKFEDFDQNLMVFGLNFIFEPKIKCFNKKL